MLRRIAGECSDGVSCPAVYVDDDGSVIVQGYEEPAEHALPAGEARVRVLRTLLLEAARRLDP